MASTSGIRQNEPDECHISSQRTSQQFQPVSEKNEESQTATETQIFAYFTICSMWKESLLIFGSLSLVKALDHPKQHLRRLERVCEPCGDDSLGALWKRSLGKDGLRHLMEAQNTESLDQHVRNVREQLLDFDWTQNLDSLYQESELVRHLLVEAGVDTQQSIQMIFSDKISTYVSQWTDIHTGERVRRVLQGVGDDDDNRHLAQILDEIHTKAASFFQGNFMETMENQLDSLNTEGKSLGLRQLFAKPSLDGLPLPNILNLEDSEFLQEVASNVTSLENESGSNSTIISADFLESLGIVGEIILTAIVLISMPFLGLQAYYAGNGIVFDSLIRGILFPIIMIETYPQIITAFPFYYISQLFVLTILELFKVGTPETNFQNFGFWLEDLVLKFPTILQPTVYVLLSLLFIFNFWAAEYPLPDNDSDRRLQLDQVSEDFRKAFLQLQGSSLHDRMTPLSETKESLQCEVNYFVCEFQDLKLTPSP
jgi:hypothetical protein